MNNGSILQIQEREYSLFRSGLYQLICPATEALIFEAGKKDLMYPENVSRMYASSNLQIFSEALQRSKEIASSITGDGIHRRGR